MVRNLLIANVLVYLLQVNLRLSPSITQLGSLYLVESPYFHVWQFFTYMFLHDQSDVMHIASNMFGLISFGPLLEQRWGGQRFLAFWLMCGVGAGVLYEGVRTYEVYQFKAAFAQVVQHPDAGQFSQLMQQVNDRDMNDYAAAEALSRNPADPALQQAVAQQATQLYNDVVASPYGGMLGASGALFGVLFAFAYLFPNTELRLIIPPIPMKAKYFVGLYALFELYSGVHRAPGDNVAHFAHLGGLVIGFIILRFWERDRSQFY
ncbi:MAG: rhomboid family intramembrane serine protease [Janthinobacterium lividum]